MRHVASMVAGLSLVMCLAGVARAQQQPAISQDSARVIALKRVPNATVSSEKMEHEKGRMVYSFDLMVPGRTGVEEVLVDAMTGNVISVKHESAKKGQEEMRHEQAESARVHTPR